MKKGFEYYKVKTEMNILRNISMVFEKIGGKCIQSDDKRIREIGWGSYDISNDIDNIQNEIVTKFLNEKAD